MQRLRSVEGDLEIRIVTSFVRHLPKDVALANMTANATSYTLVMMVPTMLTQRCALDHPCGYVVQWVSLSRALQLIKGVKKTLHKRRSEIQSLCYQSPGEKSNRVART